MGHVEVIDALDELEHSIAGLWAAVRKLRAALLTDVDALDDPGRAPSSYRLLALVARHYDITVTELTSASRRRPAMRPRQVAMFLLHEHLGMSYASVGHLLHRDHSTIVHGVRRVRAEEDTAELLALVKGNLAP